MQKSIKKLLDEGKFILGKDQLPKQEWIPTGSWVLDYAIGGGYPVGKIIEIYGDPSSGKSLLSLLAEAHVTQQKKYVLHCDLEGNHSTQELNAWRESLGVDMDYVITKEAGPAEEIIDDTVRILREAGDQIPLMVVDSIGVLTSGRTLDKKADEKTVAEEARLIRKWLAQLMQVNKHTCIILLNHTIAKIGSYTGGTTTKGGSAPKFASSIRLELKATKIKDPRGDLFPIQQLEMLAKVTKNKIAPPGRVATMTFDYASRKIDRSLELVQLGLQTGIIQRNASMYLVNFSGEESKYKGKENLKEAIEKDPTLRQFLIDNIFV